jgi:hypothetical protein
MKSKTKILFSVLLLGLAVTVHTLISDPFSIPFQDYEQLSKDVQLSYENESKNMKILQYIGLSMFVIALFSLVFLRVVKKK